MCVARGKKRKTIKLTEHVFFSTQQLVFVGLMVELIPHFPKKKRKPLFFSSFLPFPWIEWSPWHGDSMRGWWLYLDVDGWVMENWAYMIQGKKYDSGYKVKKIKVQNLI
jgi:hypothetical protein